MQSQLYKKIFFDLRAEPACVFAQKHSLLAQQCGELSRKRCNVRTVSLLVGRLLSIIDASACICKLKFSSENSMFHNHTQAHKHKNH